MEPTQLHNLFNHLPIIGTAIGFVIVGVSFFMKNKTVRNVGLLTFAVMALAAFPANYTGEDAEEQVEEFKNVDHNVIHEHEELTEIILPLAGIGAFLALTLVFFESRLGKAAPIVLVAFFVVAAFEVVQAVRAGHQGGKIRRPELTNTIPIVPEKQ
ncbi:MAG: hypothetical protein HQ472_02570 [Ignavibacteria bacterium]|nr:hypothetical protein [Ignavibacteria bacterium]